MVLALIIAIILILTQTGSAYVVNPDNHKNYMTGGVKRQANAVGKRRVNRARI